MPIPVVCSQCFTKLRAPETTVGRKTKCPKCGALVVVPNIFAGVSSTNPLLRDSSPQSLEPAAGAAASMPRKSPVLGIKIATCIVIALGTLSILWAAGTLGKLGPDFTKVGPAKQTDPQFDPQNASETARWASKLLRPLNAATKLENEIARNDLIQKELKKLDAATDHLLGQHVSWEMACWVYESEVRITQNKFGQDGRPENVDVSDNPIALMVLDHRPRTTPHDIQWSDDPDDRHFQQKIPQQISREEAGQLPNQVRVTGKIKECEIAKSGRAPFLVYIYLTEVRVAPNQDAPNDKKIIEDPDVAKEKRLTLDDLAINMRGHAFAFPAPQIDRKLARLKAKMPKDLDAELYKIDDFKDHLQVSAKLDYFGNCKLSWTIYAEKDIILVELIDPGQVGESRRAVERAQITIDGNDAPLEPPAPDETIRNGNGTYRMRLDQLYKLATASNTGFVAASPKWKLELGRESKDRALELFRLIHEVRNTR